MVTLRVLMSRVLALFTKGRRDADLNDEIRAHVEQLADEYVHRGMSPAEAKAAARREFGGVEQTKEAYRDRRSFPLLDAAAHDVRYALRQLRKNPGFAIAAIFTLALGIGASTAIFSLIDAVGTRALPYAEPDRLVELWGNVTRARVERRGASYPDYLAWRAQAKSFDDIAAFDPQMMTLTGIEEPERINVEFVSAPYFSILGRPPVQGRTFRPDEDAVSNPAAVVVISDGLWKRRFGADPDIVGRTITLSGGPFATYTVIGLMPPGFTGLTNGAELWMPFALWAPPSVMADRTVVGFGAIARLKPGVSAEGAQAEIDVISRGLAQSYPATNENRGVTVSPLDDEVFGNIRSVLFMLMGAVGFVLLIACANVANLIVARLEVRRYELAVRTSVGASPGRLCRQLVTESCVLTLLGAMVGLVFARTLVTTLVALGPLGSPVTLPIFVAPALDARVMVFTIAAALVCGIVVGLAPGWGTRAAKGAGGRRSSRFRNALVVVEVSSAVVLLVGGGLMIRSVRNLVGLHPGFASDSVLTLHASIQRAPLLPAGSSGGASVTSLPPPIVSGRVLLERLRALPGVIAASLSTDVPLDGHQVGNFYVAEGQTAVDATRRPRGYLHRVSPEFFNTLQIPILRGRAFTEAEATPESTAVIVSAGVVNRFWPGQNPIGKRIKLGSLTANTPWLSIVGVVDDVKYRWLQETRVTDPDLYVPFLDRNAQVAIAVRTSVPPASLVGAIRASIHSASASIPIYAVAPMSELIGRQTSAQRFIMWLMGAFAALALSLAMVGVYGVLSYAVAQRTHEIGIRMALGAKRADVIRPVLGQSFAVMGIGLVVGLAGASVLARFLEGMLFGLTTLDPATFIAVSLLFAAVAMLASYLPARRATRVDPLIALRCE